MRLTDLEAEGAASARASCGGTGGEDQEEIMRTLEWLAGRGEMVVMPAPL